MAREERRDTPKAAISIGEGLQILDKIPPARYLIKLVAGSDYPYYTQARWFRAEEIIDETEQETELPLAEADGEAGLATALVPRLKRKAVVVSAGRLTTHDLLFKQTYPKAEPAVAYTYRGVSHAGILPGGLAGLGNYPPDIYTAALRTGRSEFGAGIGVWIPGERTFVLPKDAGIEEQNVPIVRLAESYPGVPLV